jgi:hypothetical protein
MAYGAAGFGQERTHQVGALVSWVKVESMRGPVSEKFLDVLSDFYFANP